MHFFIIIHFVEALFKIMVCVDKLPVKVNNDVESMADFSPFSETPTSGGDDTDGVADDVLSIL